jgi:hypothetical protein
MSDPAPHWGCNFVFWPESARFWSACIELVCPAAGRNGGKAGRAVNRRRAPALAS